MSPFNRGRGRRPDGTIDALGADRRGTPRAPHARDSPNTCRPRPGWYAYLVAGATELPSWAVEIALTIERPAAPAREDLATGFADEWWGPRDPERVGAEAHALLLLRAPGRMRWLDPIAEALAEVESLAGVRSAALEVEPVGAIGAVRATRRSRLREAPALPGPLEGPAFPEPGPGPPGGPALPGLVPVMPAIARAHLRIAGSRGLPAPLRRWRPAAAGSQLSWRSTPGSVLTCHGPDGTSAQAVVALQGLGNVDAITPPPGGALVLRAWRARRSWGVACGLVLGAATTLGLGREAGRISNRARAGGWNALVLSGPIALRLARAGSPDLPAPEAAAHGATGAQVAALFAACLAAGGLSSQPIGSDRTPAVTR